MHQSQKILKNELETLFIHAPGSPSASVQIWFRAGSALESKKDFGIAHFLEHMFFKGTKKRPGAQIAHDVESFGGEVNAFTSFDYTCYYINTPTSCLKETINILMDMVANPLFDEAELVPERNVVHEEFRRSLDNPNQYNFKMLQESAFKGGYSHSILGTEKNILSFSREQVTGFRNKFYNTANALLVIGGHIEDQVALEKVIESYKIPTGKKSKLPKFTLASEATINVHSKPTNQISMTMVLKSSDYKTLDAAAEDLAINCLAHGEISPLYNDLVTDSSLASSISGSTMFFCDGGAHFLKVTCPVENFSKVLKEMESSFKRVVKKGFSEDDVLRIKNQYIASKIFEKESIESHAFSLGHGFAQSGDINCEDQFIENVRNTTPPMVDKMLLELFKRNMHIVIQHPESVKLDKQMPQVEIFKKAVLKAAHTPLVEKKSSFTSSEHDPEAKLIQIKKGIKLLYRKNNLNPTFVLHAYLKGGIAHENPSDNGKYYYLSRLLTNGYGELDSIQLQTQLENQSSYMGGFSGKNAYGLTLHGLSIHFDSALEHFKGSLLEPTLPQKYLTLEKELIKRTIENRKEDPLKQCFKLVTETVFNEHPYRMPSYGTLSSVKKISRKSLKELHQDRLSKSEVLLTYCGDQELSIVMQKLNIIFNELEPRKKEATIKNKARPLSGVVKKLPFDREQTQIFIGRSGFKSNTIEDLYLKILTSFLSGQSSELFVEVRDRQGLCYAVQPIHHTALEAGYWGIYIGAGVDKTDAAKEAIIKILNKLRDNGFKESEFKRVKKMIAGQNQMSVQTNEDYANFYSVPILHGFGLDYQYDSFEKIEKMKLNDFNAFLGKFLKTKWNVIEAGTVKHP